MIQIFSSHLNLIVHKINWKNHILRNFFSNFNQRKYKIYAVCLCQRVSYFYFAIFFLLQSMRVVKQERFNNLCVYMCFLYSLLLKIRERCLREKNCEMKNPFSINSLSLSFFSSSALTAPLHPRIYIDILETRKKYFSQLRYLDHW